MQSLTDQQSFDRECIALPMDTLDPLDFISTVAVYGGNNCTIVYGLWLDKPPQQRVRHKVWGKQLVDNARQLKLGADRAKQRTDMKMLDGTEVVRAVGAPEAGPVAEGKVLVY